MFARLGQFVAHQRWTVLVGGLLLVIFGGVWGTAVTDTGVLSQGGLEDRASQSYQAMERIRSEVGRQDADVLVLYSSVDRSTDDASFRDSVVAALEKARQSHQVEKVVSAYDADAPAAVKAALVSKDGHATYALVQLTGADDDARVQSYTKLKESAGGDPLVAAGPDVTTQLGGVRPMLDDLNTGITNDASTVEMITIPTLFILLLFVFRSVVAATMPLVIGVFSITGGLVLIRLLHYATSISVFSLNVLLFMALGLAVDYALFVVSRFREELAGGLGAREALGRTMQTAGRTVLVSGVTVTLALVGLLVFPQAYVRSMALGGMVAVVLAMLGSLTLLPALLAILGHRVDALRIPSLRRAKATGGRDGGRSGAGGGWSRVAGAVVRRPTAFALLTTAALALLALPVLGVHFGTSDERSLPKAAPSRVVADRLTGDFAIDARKSIYILVSGTGASSAEAISAEAGQFAETVSRVHGIEAGSVQVVAAKERVLSDRRTASAVIVASHEGEWTSAQARDVVSGVRALQQPAGTQVLVGGLAADLKDQLSSLADHLPLMAAIMLTVTALFLFLAFGSVLIPIQAVLLNLLSITAAFGPIVWIFQQGHLSGLLGFTPTGFLTAMEPVMMIAFAFGLSMDYSVFLLSRIREQWDASGDSVRSVVAGVQSTGRIITSAAVLLAVTIGSFVLVGVKDLKLIAVGLFVIILLDATVVRMLLVPATIRLLGDAAWWAPGPLRRLYAAYGIKESDQAGDQAPAAAGAVAGPGAGAVKSSAAS